MKRIAVTIMMGLFAIGSAAACGPDGAAAMVASAEAEALAAMGIEPEQLAVAEAATDEGAESDAGDEAVKAQWLRRWHRRHAVRVALHRRVLHGEAVVETKNGQVTVVVQRGVVTAIGETSITVESTDGYLQTWDFHDNLRVVERRATIQPSEVAIGTTVALAGPKPGDTPLARLIVIPLQR